jgi:SAM-dependent methyltransferase
MFDALYRREALDAALRRLLPPELAAPELGEIGGNGFLLLEDLALLASALSAAPPGAAAGPPVLCDLGCGRGGLGLRLARALGHGLVGVDLSPAAIAQAREAALSWPAAEPPRFHVADFADTGLPGASVSAVVSLDALYLAPDPAAALAEISRLLVPDGLLVFTAYTSARHYPGTSRLLSDWRPVMEGAGFVVERYADRTAAWRRVMRSKHALRLEAANALLRELGPSVGPELSVSASMLGLDGRPSFLDQVDRFVVVGRRRARPGERLA